MIRLGRHAGYRVVAAGVALLLTTVGSDAASWHYFAKGSISKENSSGGRQRWCDYSVAATVDGQSLISVIYFNGETFQCGTEGHDSILVNRMLPAWKKDPATAEFGDIYEGPFPSPRDLAPIQLVWLSHAAFRPVLRQANISRIESFHEDGLFARAQLVRRLSDAGLPAELKWWLAGQLLGKYEVFKQTNFMGVIIPLEWQFQLFQKSSQGMERGRDGVLTREILHGSVNEVQADGARADFLPRFERDNFYIADWRFEKELGYGFQVHLTENGKWPSRQSAEVQHLLQLHRQAREGGVRPNPKCWVLVLDILIGILCAIILLERFWKPGSPANKVGNMS